MPELRRPCKPDPRPVVKLGSQIQFTSDGKSWKGEVVDVGTSGGDFVCTANGVYEVSLTLSHLAHHQHTHLS